MAQPFSSLVPSAPGIQRTQGLKNTKERVNVSKTSRDIDRLQFFDLPREVRDKIYSHLLQTAIVRFRDRSEYVPRAIGDEMFALCRCPWDLDPTVLRVNRQLYEEASLLFYKTNLFLRVMLCTPVVKFAQILLEGIASNVAFHGTSPDLIEQSTRHVMDVGISINQSDVKRTQFMIPYTSLSSLITFISTLCNVPNADHAPFSSVEIKVRHTYGLRDDLIRQCLLEPWRRTFNIPNVSIEWPSGPTSYTEALQNDMMQKTFNAEAWLESVTNLKDNGVQAFENGMLESSIQYFDQALSAIRSVYRDARHGRRLDLISSQPEKFSIAVSRIRFDCELNISMAWVNLEDHFELARRAALNAYRIAQNSLPEEESANDAPHSDVWYSDIDRATALFCLGSASMAQGAFESALQSFAEAQRLNPHDPGISRAVAQARRRLQE